ncbi:RING-type E3 ubiquitin transferase [Yamadazyma tenuis]|uniref:UBR-type domain-containing protein n=1 Tax=Candida tenuis (strain ATCC 10573 / BCRC 21748 / CBS 615 / JCM 9827 / NBRC 10315 / NRRL Y-1498 / VKM Y-70) TaxID=590646 RepID=G3BFF1_CANTC|nr:uncharacterized protein CANTEDRAFT_111146 [Yamadazyma tenuis ATCC 10573]EGV60674.1 hypothetical protein CANTEDRAFT_111146 [Yamadazyma tenuis ATCC 10573]WEJ94075.1 RING-type E3 ubiquitin transferase [Yamadazyma tenuis]
MKDNESNDTGGADDKVTTAVAYIEEQDELEKEAKELMPYEPNECTFNQGPLRQPVFACLTCSRDNNGNAIGVCYSCSIQCHSSHEIVELFSKRSFVCDCGTTRMSKSFNGACKVRNKIDHSDESFRPRTGSSSTPSHRSWGSVSNLDSPAEDVPGSNSYNHNYKGLFCSCEKPYNPLEETGNMIQCYFGFECGEDWYHEDCILGYTKEALSKSKVKPEPSNLLNNLPEPGDEAANDISVNTTSEPGLERVVPHFPNLEDFDVFLCWKCVSVFSKVFDTLETHGDIVLCSLPHFKDVKSESEWEALFAQYKGNDEGEPSSKRIKLESSTSVVPKSVFFKFDFRDNLKQLKDTTTDDKIKNFLINHDYLYESDPVYEPPEDDESSSTLELGADVLSSLPREQAVEGLQAYNQIRSKLKDFFKPFAEQGKVVTEKEVRNFFSNIKKEDK